MDQREFGTRWLILDLNIFYNMKKCQRRNNGFIVWLILFLICNFCFFDFHLLLIRFERLIKKLPQYIIHHYPFASRFLHYNMKSCFCKLSKTRYSCHISISGYPMWFQIARIVLHGHGKTGVSLFNFLLNLKSPKK